MGWYATRNMDSDDLRKFDVRLYRPPVGYTGDMSKAGPWAPQAENQALAALSAALG